MKKKLNIRIDMGEEDVHVSILVVENYEEFCHPECPSYPKVGHKCELFNQKMSVAKILCNGYETHLRCDKCITRTVIKEWRNDDVTRIR